MASERHISWAVLPSAWPASTCRSSLTICSGVYVLVFMVVLSRPSRGRLGLPYHVDQLSGSRPPSSSLAPPHRAAFLASFRGTPSHISFLSKPIKKFPFLLPP